MTEPDRPERTPICQWCGAGASPDATRCAGCGAALGQRVSIGDLVIPGLTDVDPALAALDGQPLRIPKASPSQGIAGGAVMAAAMGGPAGLAALGGLAAVAATEYLLAGHGEAEKARLEAVGKPDELALRVLERLENERKSARGASGDASAAAEGAAPTVRASDPWRDVRMSGDDRPPAAEDPDDVGRCRHPDEDERTAE